MEAKNMLVSLFAGIATGAILGVVLTSGKSSSSKNDIVKKSSDLADALDHKIDDRFGELMRAFRKDVKKKSGEQVLANTLNN